MTTASGPSAWVGTATAFGSADESTCQEGVNCDTYTLNVGGTPADWQTANKVIKVALNWQISANDYDLYIHKDSNAGPVVSNSGNSAPSTQESAVINPASTGTGLYTIHVVYFAGTSGADQYHGSATVTDTPAAIYLKGGFTFSTPRTVSAPATTSDGEPSSRCDKFGNYYVAGIRGVPAGVDLWYFNMASGNPLYDPNLRNPSYRGQPDSFTGESATSVGADGGGDVDIAVGFPTSGVPIVAFTSLVISNISSSVSYDMGKSWTKNPIGNVTGGLPVDDRQWIEFYGDHDVYLLYRTFQPAVTQIQHSSDGGLTWGPARTAGPIGQVGSCDVDQHDGTVYVTGSDGKIAVGIPDPLTHEPTTFTVYQPVSGGNANLFLVCKVADDGTVYLCYSDGHTVNLAYSRDKGATWSVPARVSDGPETKTALLPWMETGPVPGSLGIVWYGSPAANDDDTADWKVFFAQCMNANSSMPTFTQQTVTPYVIHGSNISLGGTLGNDNRNLLDYFQISFDPQGQALIAYTDDHNDYDGCVFVTHQIGGKTVTGAKANGHPHEGSGLPPQSSPSSSDPQVTDPVADVTDAVLGMLPTTDPLDITSVKYWNTTSGSNKVIWAQMKVSNLGRIPPASNWRMSFTLNAPGTTSSIAAGGFTYGVSDRGDQFYVQATTDATGVLSYTWGTAVRNSDGTMTYTSRGAADSGALDPLTGTITLSVSGTKLAPLCTHGPAPRRGSVVCGLRGHAFTTGAVSAKYDRTRGGTQFTIQ
jgi:hypothetical protein